MGIVKRRDLKQFKRVKTPRMSSATQQRRTERAGALAEKFSKKRSIERCVWQDEKYFPVDVPFNAQNNRVYGMDKKDKIPGNRLFHHANKQSKKVMVSACVTWKGATKPFFVNENGLKVNAKTYKKHLEKQLFPEVNRLLNGTSWIFLQNSTPSHCSNLVQNFLKEKLSSKFIKHTEWPPSLPDCNPLDYHFWNKIKEKVYEDHFGPPFKSEDKLKKTIKKVWSEVMQDLPEIRRALKQFAPRLACVEEKSGGCIKMIFG